MRLHIIIEGRQSHIPFQHQRMLTGAVYKWLGQTEHHGVVSLYSFSSLENLQVNEDGFRLGEYTKFFFSSHEPELIKNLTRGILNDSKMFDSLRVVDLTIEDNPELSTIDRFLPGSPIFIKRRVGEARRNAFFYYSDLASGNYLEETLTTKMKKAGIEPDDSLRIRFDLMASNASIRKVDYNGIENKASWCPVIIKGRPETKLFAWNVGLGNSTGIGFGAIR